MPGTLVPHCGLFGVVNGEMTSEEYVRRRANNAERKDPLLVALADDPPA